ncbi:DNA methyltransferase [Micrococcus luteus]|uniref:class I SAM-dependent DNA methyltransferase n=1 Tax=Micrococcus luteus TaxID=1270 RepID=UPI0012F450A6|nr:DNA methyltransferase [Micrococcus luteus]VWX52295.1 DNA methyltransferase [Micrococcus luteus]
MADHKQAARKRAAKEFAKKWAGRGYEKGDTSSFWLELLRDVVGMEDVTTNVRFENRTTERGFIDVVIRDAKTVIEQKSLGVDLDKAEMRQGVAVTPFGQAKRYADSLRNSERPDTIIVCDFDRFRIHDLDTEHPERDYEEFRLAELPEQLHLLDFLLDPQRERQRRETQVSLDAGALIGKLYDMLRAQYIDPDSEASMHSLNVLCVRLVFLLFAEDAGLFPKNAFHHYLKPVPADRARAALKELFAYLNAAPQERDPYASDALKAFPYVNGGLFAADVEIPQLTQDIVDMLLDEVSEGTDWSQISPTVFGGVFESTLNPETRRSGGMHYTSPQNIHRLIDPLFLDALKVELDGILTAQGVGDRKRRNELARFHDKIAGLRFFDPACGSGNFLTETYIQLRKLENKILSVLLNDQGVFELQEQHSLLKVSLQQFHGIEINDFAVNVATTALWIAELQANAEAETIVYGMVKDLPLKDSAHIVLGNALTVDWTEVLDPSGCDYIIGNPPFRGARFQTGEQKTELMAVFHGARNAGNIDYVAGWYMKAAQYMGEHPVRAGFVSTNSICQGEQVANVWSPIYDLGVRIDFAHDTFRWTTDASGGASVYVVIVGFSKLGGPKCLFHYPRVDAEPEESSPAQLNAYLKDAPDVFVWSRSRPLSDVPAMGIGSQPIDGGQYLFTPAEKAEFLAQEPAAERFFHRWYGSQEFIRGIERWVLWLGEATPAELASMPQVLERVRAVREYRLASKRGQTVKAAARPQHFGTEIIPEGNSLLIPEVSSERRRYIPIGFISPEVLCSNKVRLIPNATLYHFGVLHSRTHNSWMRVVGVRLKSDYSYSGAIVYNNFVWPTVNSAQKAEITALAQRVLDTRSQHPDATMASFYDPATAFLYPDLTAAHQALDDAVERAYGLEPGLDEADLVAHLFELYAKAVRATS